MISGIVVLLALVALLWIRPSGTSIPPEKTTERAEAPPTIEERGEAKDSFAVETSPPAPPVPPTPVHRSAGRIPATTAPRNRGPMPTLAFDVSGHVDSWQDWNSSFSDTVTRTYSAIFDSARLDTLPRGILAFSPSGKNKDFRPVKRVFCRIDSVQDLVKYTFPGQSVRFNIGVAFAASVAFRGDLHPERNPVALTPFTPEYDNTSAITDIVRNQFIVVLHSPTGYAYALRTGIECEPPDDSMGTTTYFTRPVVVEFRRMIRYESLLSSAAETVFLLTGNPRAVSDVSRALPGSLISVVFVPRNDPHEAEALGTEKLANVRLVVSTPRILEQSFVILNESEALVEETALDPDFKHIAQLRTKSIAMDEVGYPRVTRFISNKSAVSRLKGTYNKLRQLNP